MLRHCAHSIPFRLRVFREGPLTFALTYKYNWNSDAFDTSEKRRVPAWSGCTMPSIGNLKKWVLKK